MSDIAIDVSAHSIGQDTNASLEMVGIVAVQVWLPLDQVDLLNAQDDVLLADASSSYLRLVAAKVSSANELGLRLDDHEFNLDGLPKYIVAEARDIYAESRVFFNHPR
ncbi:MAG: hypothetical protein V9H69_22240 [Anaerolineae bacterium]